MQGAYRVFAEVCQIETGEEASGTIREVHRLQQAADQITNQLAKQTLDPNYDAAPLGVTVVNCRLPQRNHMPLTSCISPAQARRKA